MLRKKSHFLFSIIALSTEIIHTRPFSICNHQMSTSSIAKEPINSLLSLNFDNNNLKSLPIDSEKRNFPRQVHNAIFSLVTPQSIKNPVIVAYSKDALSLLNINVNDDNLSSLENEILLYLSGNNVLPGSRPASHCYCGHQFGSFSGQLGDGAAMYLGEVVLPSNKRFELQLKGSGPTPYSRTADGRKVLRSSIREFLCSEAMHYLHIPTTRAATCITSDSTVRRDPFYDGGVLNERCTVVSRIATNFFRFGSFEIFKSQDGVGENARVGPSAGNEELKKKLLNHMLIYFPHILSNNDLSEVDKYKEFYKEVVISTAKLVVKWQCNGWVHGVLNTDNMSIMGLTIDYGPYGFMEYFDPDYVPNGSDGSARYSYQKQPEICKWNLKIFSEMLSPLLPLDISNEVIKEFDIVYDNEYMKNMCDKLGFMTANDEIDRQIISELFNTMHGSSTDFTDTFQALISFVNTDKLPGDVDLLIEKLLTRSATPAQLISINKRKMKIHQLGMHPEQIMQIWTLLENSPEKVEEMFGGVPIQAIRAEIGGEKKKLDLLVKANSEIKRLSTITAVSKDQENRELWEIWVDTYRRRLAAEDKSLLNFETINNINSNRKKLMIDNNPSFIIRNWIIQKATETADKGDFTQVRTVLKMAESPFNPSYSIFSKQDCDIISSNLPVSEEEKEFIIPAPAWSDSFICTCSS